MTKKSSFERVHESSVALMRENAHTSGASRVLSLNSKDQRRRANGDELCSEDADHFGWYRGIVTKCATEADKKKVLCTCKIPQQRNRRRTSGVSWRWAHMYFLIS